MSNLFVVLMGVGTVFFGLVCLIVLSSVMSAVLRRNDQPAPKAAAPAAPSAPAAIPDRQALVAAIATAIAEELGTDLSGIRILSITRV